MLRLYDATSGEILINGKSIKKYSPSELRMNVGIAFQDTPVYSLSLRDNMSAYNEVDQKTFESVCNKIPLLKKVLEKNEANIDSQITRSFDSKGIVLSGGEKQTISISRVLSKKFKMLIFDEPTSALDPVAADSMSKSIFDVKNDTTTVFISHKLSSVIDADHIYVFSNGEIVEDGTHISLMEKHGIYYNMFTAQADKYKAGLLR